MSRNVGDMLCSSILLIKLSCNGGFNEFYYWNKCPISVKFGQHRYEYIAQYNVPESSENNGSRNIFHGPFHMSWKLNQGSLTKFMK